MSARTAVIHSNRPTTERPVAHPVGCLCEPCQRAQLDAPPSAVRLPTTAAAALDELRRMLDNRTIFLVKRDRSRTGGQQTIGAVYVTPGRELRSIAWLVAAALHRRYVPDKDGITMPGGEAARMVGDLSEALYGDRRALVAALI